MVSVIAAGFWFAAQFQSPAQQEASAKPPAPGPVFAEVTQGSLVGEVSFTGQVGPSTQIPVTVLPVPDASLSVVTGRPLEAGASASSGQVLTEVNGRPLFGIRAPFAFYRDMGIGDHGPDVEALQEALIARSYQLVADGRFGDETAAAVTLWYTDSGYEAPSRSGSVVESTESDEARDSSMQMPTREVYVPVTEILALPTNSAQVIQGLQVGQRLAVEGQPDFVLGSTDLVVTVTIPVAELGEVMAGDAATISMEGARVEGTVGELRTLGSAEGAEGQPPDTSQDGSASERAEAPSEVTFTVIPTSALPASTGPARVTVIEQMVAEDALIVPVLAVSDRGPDKNVLMKQQDDGSLVEVPVTVLGTLQGEVAVAAIEDGALGVGDHVRVG